MTERRNHPRDRTYLGGRIAFNNQCCSVDCLVRNISDAGAKLVFSFPVPIPSVFDLIIEQKGSNRYTRIVWRSRMEVGVLFQSTDATSAVPIETIRRIRTLQAERDGLARRIAQLSTPIW
jgi:hypothetical protein